MEGSCLHLAKRGCDEIASSLVVTRTNLIPSFSLTHAKKGTASTDSKSVFISWLPNTFLTGLPGEMTVRLSNSDTIVSRLPNTEHEWPERRHSELVCRRIGWDKPWQSKCSATISPRDNTVTTVYINEWVGSNKEAQSCTYHTSWSKAFVPPFIWAEKK